MLYLYQTIAGWTACDVKDIPQFAAPDFGTVYDWCLSHGFAVEVVL